MKLDIFLFEKKRPGCNLGALRQEGSAFALITTADNFPQYSSQDRSCFQFIEIVADMDLDTVSMAVSKLIRDYDKNNVRIICGTEMVLTLGAEVREKLSIHGDSAEYVKRFIDKSVAKAALVDSDVRLPKYCIYDLQRALADRDSYMAELETKLGYPMFIKPTDLYLAIDSIKIPDREALNSWLDTHQKISCTYEIDEFITGKLYHCDSIVQDNSILFSVVGEYMWPCDLFSKGYPLGTIEVSPDSEKFERINEFACNTILHMKPNNCSTHMEIFESAKGDLVFHDELIFLEMGARPPGGPLVDLHDKQWGINMNYMHYACQLGIPVTQRPQANPERYCAWAYFPIMPGTIKAINAIDISSDAEIEIFVCEGQHFSENYFIREEIMFLPKYIAGTVFFSHNDYDVVREDFEKLRHFKLIEYEE
jgi:hypothetical protein